jgi:acetyl-CoA synthetase
VSPENRRSRGGGIPHNIKGQAIYAYVTLNHGEEPTPELYAEVRNWA